MVKTYNHANRQTCVLQIRKNPEAAVKCIDHINRIEQSGQAVFADYSRDGLQWNFLRNEKFRINIVLCYERNITFGVLCAALVYALLFRPFRAVFLKPR